MTKRFPATDEIPEESCKTALLVTPTPWFPVIVYSRSLAVIALVAVVFALHWAKVVFIPLMLGVIISYALSAPLNVMERWHIPRAIGAAVLLLSIVGGMASAVYMFSDDANNLIQSLPDAAYKLRRALTTERGTREGAMEKVQKAASQLEQAASETSTAPPPVSKGVTRVQIEKPKLDVKDYLWMGTKGVIGFAGQLIMVMFLVYFIMVSSGSIRHKLTNMAGPTRGGKTIPIDALNEISDQIRRYLLVQVSTSVLVGVVTWLAFLWIGVKNAAVWGIAAGVFNTVPYVGPVIVTGGTSLVAFLQFGTLNMTLLVGGVSLLITSLEGYLLTPWLTGRAGRMSPLVVFVSVLFWGWLWGVWGLLLGVPIMMMIKSVCDRVDDLKPIGELLGD